MLLKSTECYYRDKNPAFIGAIVVLSDWNKGNVIMYIGAIYTK